MLNKTQFKFVLIGPEQVGKTELSKALQNWCTTQTINSFSVGHTMTVGNGFRGLPIDDHSIIQLWDTAGSENFSVLIPALFNGTACLLVVFNLGDEASLGSALKMFNQHKNKMPEGILIILVGNQSDLDGDSRLVSRETAEARAQQEGMTYVEVSAKNELLKEDKPSGFDVLDEVIKAVVNDPAVRQQAEANERAQNGAPYTDRFSPELSLNSTEQKTPTWTTIKAKFQSAWQWIKATWLGRKISGAFRHLKPRKTELTESAVKKLFSDYVARIEAQNEKLASQAPANSQPPAPFSYGFWFGKETRSANRQANYELAKTFAQKPISSDSLEKAQVLQSRNVFAGTMRIFHRDSNERLIKNRGINSRQLNKALSTARKFCARNSK